MEASITTYPYLFPEDLYDNDDTFQKILHISFFPPTNYDYYSLMSYSNLYTNYLNEKMISTYFQE
ncbi:MAG: hypothetical protein GF329_22685 [Candidatus Lokiarchaeota archaeon]|nr:hypothetical protein [Candidatus Lokiarchaeota archaeon]